MSHFRFRYTVAGGHTHMDVFAGSRREVTHGKCGTLCMTNAEFRDFMEWTRQADIEFVEEGKGPSATPVNLRAESC